MPEEFREVLILREMEDLSYREIAEITGTPIGTVMSRLARARDPAAGKREGVAYELRSYPCTPRAIWTASWKAPKAMRPSAICRPAPNARHWPPQTADLSDALRKANRYRAPELLRARVAGGAGARGGAQPRAASGGRRQRRRRFGAGGRPWRCSCSCRPRLRAWRNRSPMPMPAP